MENLKIGDRVRTFVNDFDPELDKQEGIIVSAGILFYKVKLDIPVDGRDIWPYMLDELEKLPE